MLFNSLEFVVFFLAFYGLYAVLGHKRQNNLLLVASYIFYGAWDWRFLGLLMISTTFDWLVGLGLQRTQEPVARKRLLVFSIFVNLGILGTFKYFNFFTASFVDLATALGFSVSPLAINVVLPVGVSFYTFQSMSYTIDVYRRQMQPCPKLLDFATYVGFFPQLVAGPIERAVTLLPQVLNPRVITASKIGAGLALIAVGFFKKVVVADNLSPTADAIFAIQGPLTGEQVAIGVLFFAFQIYCDFSGYTDIARGIARLLGFELMLNFRQPFFANSPSDFWQRWHISLSSWLRDYLYFSLGGNRDGRRKTYRNLMLTMVIGGLWHGAAWNFVWWGVFHGSLLVVYRMYQEFGPTPPESARNGVMSRFREPLAIAIMFIFTLYGWLLFRAHSGAQILEMTRALGHWTSIAPLAKAIVELLFYAWPVILMDYLQYRAKEIEPIFVRAPVQLQTACILGFILMLFMFGRFDGASFIYFQF